MTYPAAPSTTPLRVRVRLRPPREARCLRVLLAEDDIALRDLLRAALARDGCVVTEARSGRELLEHLGHVVLRQRRRPDVIVADHRMPGPKGLDVFEGLHAAGWQLPLVIMTAFATQEVRLRAAAIGAPLLDKPFDVASLVATVRRAADLADCGHGRVP